MSLLDYFNPFGGALQPGARFPQYTTAPPGDGRTAYTGVFGADQFNQPGNVNQQGGDPMNGPVLGGSGEGPGGSHYGPVPFGGWSQLAGRTNGSFSGYYPPANPGYEPPQFDPYAGDINGRPLSGPNGPLPTATPKPGELPATPKPGELPAGRQTMMGQWGGGGWNVGSGAPASAQPMWLGSVNGGQSWGQAPGYNANAPQAGQQTGMWKTAPNQDADSPTWVQRG